ncbi:response regulator [Qipengyuania sp.]|uniref:response regulator n=1 Tax=Qipengyuania sp. TaxID=2004515 RepID=UPI0035C87B6A
MRSATKPSVVVVDSDPINCRLMREICLVAGWEPAGCAGNMEEGLALVAGARPECLITDYDFGNGGSCEGTGLDLIEKAKLNLPHLFTILATGWDINELAVRMQTQQPDRILRKPVPPHQLMKLLENVHGQVEVVRIRAV